MFASSCSSFSLRRQVLYRQPSLDSRLTDFLVMILEKFLIRLALYFGFRCNGIFECLLLLWFAKEFDRVGAIRNGVVGRQGWWTHVRHGFERLQSSWQTTAFGWTHPGRAKVQFDTPTHVARDCWIVDAAFNAQKASPPSRFPLLITKWPMQMPFLKKRM